MKKSHVIFEKIQHILIKVNRSPTLVRFCEWMLPPNVIPCIPFCKDWYYENTNTQDRKPFMYFAKHFHKFYDEIRDKTNAKSWGELTMPDCQPLYTNVAYFFYYPRIVEVPKFNNLSWYFYANTEWVNKHIGRDTKHFFKNYFASKIIQTLYCILSGKTYSFIKRIKGFRKVTLILCAF